MKYNPHIHPRRDELYAIFKVTPLEALQPKIRLTKLKLKEYEKNVITNFYLFVSRLKYKIHGYLICIYRNLKLKYEKNQKDFYSSMEEENILKDLLKKMEEYNITPQDIAQTMIKRQHKDTSVDKYSSITIYPSHLKDSLKFVTKEPQAVNSMKKATAGSTTEAKKVVIPYHYT